MSTAASQPRSEMPRRIVLMGVAGSGKSAVGAALAACLGATYLDGDDLHPAENIAKMSRGEPLGDEDRWPWLTLVGQRLADPDGMLIIGCSALVFEAHSTDYQTEEALAKLVADGYPILKVGPGLPSPIARRSTGWTSSLPISCPVTVTARSPRRWRP